MEQVISKNTLRILYEIDLEFDECLKNSPPFEAELNMCLFQMFKNNFSHKPEIVSGVRYDMFLPNIKHDGFICVGDGPPLKDQGLVFRSHITNDSKEKIQQIYVSRNKDGELVCEERRN